MNYALCINQREAILKIFHTSDWHLGRMLYGRSLLEDQEYFINEIFLAAAEREKPDLVIISGDIYDRKIAPTEAIRLFDSSMQKLSEMGIKIAVISGNHDSAERMAVMKPLLRKAGMFVSTSLEDALEPVVLESGGEKLQLFLVPYLDNAEVRSYFGDEELRGEASCMFRVLEELASMRQEDAVSIIAAHCFVSGASNSGSESPIFVGGSGEIPSAVFSEFDYAALGHLHGPQKVGENGRYSGSPLKYSVDEEHQNKSFVIMDIENGQLTYRTEPIAALRDVRRISGLFDDIMEQGKAAQCRDYVEIILEDSHPVLMAAQKLEPYYPKQLAVRSTWALQQLDNRQGERRGELDEKELFTWFMKDICGTEITDMDRELFSEILHEIQTADL